MFVLLLSYIRPIEEVDALMREHVAWLNQHYDAGRFVVSGRRVPRTGGARVVDERERVVLVYEDPAAVALAQPDRHP